MIDLLGWCCTALVLLGYILNSRQMLRPALVVWIVGDVGWIVYDMYIDNLSHLVLCITIIGINIYGIINALIKEKNGRSNLGTS